MNTCRYHAFGQTIQSDIELPMLLAAKKYAKTTLRIRKDKIDQKGLQSPRIVQLHYQSSPGNLWLHIPGVGLFLISNGNEIRYQAEKTADEKTLGLFLSGTCMAALFHQRGMTALHAMAVKLNEEAVVFASASGEGKSLLAAAMHKKDYKIITDDLCVIDDKGKIQPGYPALKIWRDCFGLLEIKPDELERVRPQVEKYWYRLNKGYCAEPLPVKSIYILHTWNKDAPEIKPITGMNKLIPLQAQIYRLQYLQGLGLMESSMSSLMKLAGKIKLCRFTRPQNYKMEKWIELIETDFNSI